MKLFLKTTLACALAFAPIVSHAFTQTSFTYSGLYKSLKTSKESTFSQLSLNFLLLENKNNSICPVDNVTIADGEQTLKVLMASDGALYLPLDKGLKKDHAAISFKTPKYVGCHLSMEISVAEFELESLTKENMLSWLDQFDALYSRLAGWPGRYFMPSVTGLNFKIIGKNVSAQIESENNVVKTLPLDQSALYLSRAAIEQLADNSQLRVIGKLDKVLPRLEK